MAEAGNNRITKKRGRPKGSTGAVPAMGVTTLRLPKELTAAVEGWAARQPDHPARSEAFRRLVEMGLASAALSLPHSPKTRAKAAALASKTIDLHTDQSATPLEQQSRKRRLLKGPKEFRQLRKDNSDD
jgi:hypothetical protein